jgi:hypothetical protein
VEETNHSDHHQGREHRQEDRRPSPAPPTSAAAKFGEIVVGFVGPAQRRAPDVSALDVLELQLRLGLFYWPNSYRLNLYWLDLFSWLEVPWPLGPDTSHYPRIFPVPVEVRLRH